MTKKNTCVSSATTIQVHCALQGLAATVVRLTPRNLRFKPSSRRWVNIQIRNLPRRGQLNQSYVIGIGFKRINHKACLMNDES